MCALPAGKGSTALACLIVPPGSLEKSGSAVRMLASFFPLSGANHPKIDVCQKMSVHSVNSTVGGGICERRVLHEIRAQV